MSKRLLLFVILTSLFWAGCGGDKKDTTPTGVTVTISPTNPSVAGATTQQFTATVTGSTNTAVTWQVNGVTGGDATNGTISTTGLYTAPTVLPTTTTVSVTAVSQADTTKTSSTLVTLTAPAVTISISPTSATVPAGGTQQFTPTVTVTGSTNNAVTWSVSGVQGGDPIHGTIDANGLYTAPASPPKAAITVTATSQANTAFTAKAPITLQYGNASLNGTYVFLANQGDNSSGSGFAYRGGTFVADGAGNITSGVSDSNSSASVAATNVSLAGTYSVAADGRGTMNLTDASGSHSFSFALSSNTRGQIIASDAAVSSGFLHLQDANATVNGTYVFGMSGDNGGPAAAVGQLTFSGTTVTGTEDVNSSSGGPVTGTAITGSFTVPSEGRGTATFNTAQFVFYVIDASTLALVNVDSSGLRIAGSALAQSSAQFSNASLGSSAFFVSGSAVSGNKPYALASRFDTNFAGQFSSGVSDSNNGGTLASNVAFNGATYTVGANGRTQIGTGTSNFIVWLASQKQGFVLQTDPTVVASGALFQQQAGFQSVTGGYAFAIAGANSAGSAPQVAAGQLTIAGFGSISGREDVNVNGTVQSAQPFTGNLTIATTGRATGSIVLTPPAVNYDFYFISPDRFIILSSDSNTVLSGLAERQCSDCQF